jgi:hypothetical protein
VSFWDGITKEIVAKVLACMEDVMHLPEAIKNREEGHCMGIV